MEEDKNSIFFYCKRIYELHTNFFNRLIKEYGLTMSQAEVLMYINFKNVHDGEIYVSQKDIQEYMCLSHPTVIGLLARLKENGFISIKTDKTDKRRRNVILTGKTKELGEKIKEVFSDSEEFGAEILSNDETEALNNILTKLYYGIRQKMSNE